MVSAGDAERFSPKTETEMQTINETTYFTPTQTAAMIRKALKAQFPGVKFRVTTSKYSGGSSIYLTWTNGPSVDEVNEIAGNYEGRGFDGSIDMAYYIDAWMLNGEVIGTRSRGTVASRGYVPAWGLINPHDDAELVNFGGSMIRLFREVAA